MLRRILILSSFQRFSFHTGAELQDKAGQLGIDIPFTEDISVLFEKKSVTSRTLPNRFAVHPMEGFDSFSDGSPSDRVFRRYLRYAAGGSGLIWFEAASVVPEGKSNPHQMMLTDSNLGQFKYLLEKVRNKAHESFGLSHDLFCVLQLTHSGRFSKPDGTPKPQVARLIPDMDGDESFIKILADTELDFLQEQFVESAKLAYSAGFDAVDIKACHGYLVNDLLASFTRIDSKYGGSFSNRTRFLLETVRKIHSEIPNLLLSVRLNIYDGLAYPYGFGVSSDGSLDVDLKEPTKLIERLVKSGCSLLNLTLGNPHEKPHLGRPFDRPLALSSVPSEHPLKGVGRFLQHTAQIQKLFPQIPIVGTGYSWLRQYFPQVGAAAVRRGEVSFVGLGRSSFAYPNAPRDLMEKGQLDRKKMCVTCSCCSELARAGYPTGCVIRDKTIYAKEYRDHFKKGGRR